MSDSERTTRREVLKKGTFVAPIILTLPAVATFARAGSYSQGGNSQGGNSQGGNSQGGNNQQ
jgi:hypothetical protein